MKEIKIGLAGLGSVGSGVYNILKKDADLISSRTQSKITIVAAASRTRKDFLDKNVRFYSDILQLATDPEIDVVVEAIGGKTIAKDLIIAAIKNGKKVVTANKALIAEEGFELAKLLEENNSYLGFEASTIAANPVIKSFKESFAGTAIKEFYGILNGTSNFILSKMLQEKRTYDDVLKEAQSLGYVEADSALDLKGIDAAHKLVILCAIALGAKPQFAKTHIEGIDNVTFDDISLSSELGYKIKLLGVFKNLGNESFQAVYPSLVPASEKIAQIDDAYNGLLTLTENANWNLMLGSGAGSLPTGLAVVSDIIDIARGSDKTHLFNVPAADLKEIPVQEISKRFGKYFIRLSLDKDLAKQGDLTEKLFAGKIKIKQAHLINKEEQITCGFITEDVLEKDFLRVFADLDKSLVRNASFLRVSETKF